MQSGVTTAGTADTPTSPRTSSFFQRTAPPISPGTAVTGSVEQPQTPSPAALNPTPDPRQDIQAPIANGANAGDAAASASASAAAEKLASAPAPPRWRFVNEARKSCGYSSAHAGTYVRGKSSHELGAEYVAPDISLFKPRRHSLEVHDLEYELPTTVAPVRDDRDVGQLHIQEATRDETTRHSSGTFPGLPERGPGPEAGARTPFKEWNTTVNIGPRKERERAWQGGDDVRDSYTTSGDGSEGATARGVGKIQFRGAGASEDSFNGELGRRDRTRPADDGVGREDVDSYGEPREGSLFLHNAGWSHVDEKGGGDLAVMTEVDKGAQRKRRCLFLLLLVPLLLGILLAVLLVQVDQDDELIASGIVAGVLLPPVVVANETTMPSSYPSSVVADETTMPSSYPSSSPNVTSPPPSAVQSASPSHLPTANPTCRTLEQEFNLCLAVDMSGSVCNGDSGSDCLECRTSLLGSLLPMFFSSECRDGTVSEDTCCTNFANVKDFSSLVVDALGELPGENSFSVVQFATNAQLVSGRSTAARARAVLDGLDYTGGLTNHAAAIGRCRGSLAASPSGPLSSDDGASVLPWAPAAARRDVLVLVTDGVPSEPAADPEGAAAAAARAARDDGIVIVPVFIAPDNDGSALSFMRGLSSDGEVFDVTDFASLDSVRDRLVQQVSCS